jgi:hypothetical protein
MRTDPLPIRIGLGYSTARYAPVSVAIRYLTRKPMSPFGTWSTWSHAFLAFGMSDDTTVIHEALGNTGWRAKSYADLLAWHKKSPRNHPFEIMWLPITTLNVINIYEDSVKWLGTRSYSFRQVAAFAMAESMVCRKLKIMIVADDSEVMCSEGQTQLVGTRCPEWDLRRRKDLPFCLMTPQGSYDAAKEKLAVYGSVQVRMA